MNKEVNKISNEIINKSDDSELLLVIINDFCGREGHFAFVP